MENNNPQNEKVLVKVSDIMKKVRTKEDMVNVMREKGKININQF